MRYEPSTEPVDSESRNGVLKTSEMPNVSSELRPQYQDQDRTHRRFISIIPFPYSFPCLTVRQV
jgi:hypothetical protein